MNENFPSKQKQQSQQQFHHHPYSSPNQQSIQSSNRKQQQNYHQQQQNHNYNDNEVTDEMIQYTTDVDIAALQRQQKGDQQTGNKTKHQR